MGVLTGRSIPAYIILAVENVAAACDWAIATFGEIVSATSCGTTRRLVTIEIEWQNERQVTEIVVGDSNDTQLSNCSGADVMRHGRRRNARRRSHILDDGANQAPVLLTGMQLGRSRENSRMTRTRGHIITELLGDY